MKKQCQQPNGIAPDTRGYWQKRIKGWKPLNNCSGEAVRIVVCLMTSSTKKNNLSFFALESKLHFCAFLCQKKIPLVIWPKKNSEISFRLKWPFSIAQHFLECEKNASDKTRTSFQGTKNDRQYTNHRQLNRKLKLNSNHLIFSTNFLFLSAEP